MIVTGTVTWIGYPKKQSVWLTTQIIIVENETDTIPIQLISAGKVNTLHWAKELNKGQLIEMEFNIFSHQSGGDFYPKFIIHNIKKINETSQISTET